MPSGIFRRHVLALALAAVAAPAAVLAAPFPDKPIRLVVAFPPGGGSDLIARTLGKSLSDALGQPVVVENMPGALGSVAGAHVAKAPADGHTLMLGTTGTLSIPVAMQAKLPYDTVKDFTPVIQVAITPIVLVVHPSFPAKSYAEFAAFMKGSTPEHQFYSTWGNGSVGHFIGELLKTRAGVPMSHVPYKGSGPLVNDLLAGHVKVGFLEVSTATPLVQSGKLRALAVASTQRATSLPEVPTLRESGVDYSQGAWYGIVGPKNLPPEVVGKLNASLHRILDSQEIRQKFAGMGLVPTPAPAGDFRKVIEGDVDTWTQVARKSGIKAD